MGGSSVFVVERRLGVAGPQPHLVRHQSDQPPAPRLHLDAATRANTLQLSYKGF